MISADVVLKTIAGSINMSPELLPSVAFIVVTGMSFIMLDLLFDVLYGSKK